MVAKPPKTGLTHKAAVNGPRKPSKAQQQAWANIDKPQRRLSRPAPETDGSKKAADEIARIAPPGISCRE
jgi:hypothetical protein